MANARVELTGSLTHTARGRTFKRGKPQYLNSPGEIAYYERQAGFSVVDLAEKPAPAPVPSKPEAPEDDGPVVYSKDKLKGLKKNALVELATEFEVLLTGEEKKSEMVKAILDAQDEQLEALEAEEE